MLSLPPCFHLQTSTMHGHGMVLNCPCNSSIFHQEYQHISHNIFSEEFHLRSTYLYGRHQIWSWECVRIMQGISWDTCTVFPIYMGKVRIQDTVKLWFASRILQFSEFQFHIQNNYFLNPESFPVVFQMLVIIWRLQQQWEFCMGKCCSNR